MTLREKKLDEVKKNFAYYQEILKTLGQDKHGQYLLLKNAKAIEYYDNIIEANDAAHSMFEDGLFSIQKVARRPAELGIYRHAQNLRNTRRA